MTTKTKPDLARELLQTY